MALLGYALALTARRDRGQRRFPAELVALIEGMALRRPAPSIAHVHRQTITIAAARVAGPELRHGPRDRRRDQPWHDDAAARGASALPGAL